LVVHEAVEDDPILEVLKEPLATPHPTQAPGGSKNDFVANLTNPNATAADHRNLTQMGPDGKYTVAPINVGRDPVKPLTAFNKMRKAENLAAKGPNLEKAKALCMAKRQAASLKCGIEFCHAGSKCHQPCPHGYRQPKPQVVPTDGYGQTGMMSSFHVVHEVGNKERGSKEARDKELHSKELQQKEKAQKFSYFGDVVAKEAEAKKQVAAEVAVKEKAGKSKVTNEAGEKLHDWQAEIVAVRTNASVVCHKAGLKQLQVCEVRKAEERRAKAAAIERKEKKVEQELIKQQEEQKEKLIDRIIKARGSAVGSAQGLKDDLLNSQLAANLTDAEKAEQAEIASLQAAHHALEESANNHTAKAEEAKVELEQEEHMSVPSYASGQYGSGAAPFESADGMTASMCLALDVPTCITTLGCHLDIDSNACVEGEGAAINAPSPSAEAAAAEVETNEDPLSGDAIVPQTDADSNGKYTGKNSGQGLLADAVNNALAANDVVPVSPSGFTSEAPEALYQQVGTLYEELLDSPPAPKKRSVEKAQGEAPETLLAQYGGSWESNHKITLAKEKTGKYKQQYDLASDIAKHNISIELTKTQHAEQAADSADANVTLTNQTATDDGKVKGLYDNELALLANATHEVETRFAAEQAEHSHFLKESKGKNDTEVNCTDESQDTVMMCEMNSTQFLIDKIKHEWSKDAQNASDTYKKKVEEGQSKETELTQEAAKAHAALLEVRKAANESVVAIAKLDNVTRDGFGPEYAPPPTPTFGDYTDEEDVADNINPRKDLYVEDVDSKECQAPRGEAWKQCVTIFDPVYAECTEAFEAAGAGEIELLDYMAAEQALADLPWGVDHLELIQEEELQEPEFVEAEPLDW